MKHSKNYTFYHEYIGQKCDYETYKMRLRNKYPPEVAIYPWRLNKLTRGYTMEQKIEEAEKLRSEIAKVKQQLYKNQELKELRRKLKIVRATILNIKKNKAQ